MYSLTEEQQQTLIDIVSLDFGLDLTYGDFVEATLTLFEDIPGFEAIPAPHASSIVNQLWRKYHEQESQKAG